VLLLASLVLSLAILFFVLRWVFADPEIDRDLAKRRFQAEEAWRAMRRDGKL